MRLICINMGFRSYVLFQTIVLCAYTNITMSGNSETISGNSYAASGNGYKMLDNSDETSEDGYKTSSVENSVNFLGLSPLYKLYNKCVGKDEGESVEECLSTQVVILIDAMAHEERIILLDGIQLVGKQKSLGRSISGQEQMLTEESLESSLPRNLATRQGILYNLILHKLSDFLKTHRLEVELPTSRTIKGTYVLGIFRIRPKCLKGFKCVVGCNRVRSGACLIPFYA